MTKTRKTAQKNNKKVSKPNQQMKDSFLNSSALKGVVGGAIFALGALTFTSAQAGFSDDAHYSQGSGDIQQNGNHTIVDQHTSKGVISAEKFGVNTDEYVQIINAQKTLIKVWGNDPSDILGRLSSTGFLAISNQNGIFFGPNSSVDVNGLLATTSGIKDSDFMADRLTFNTPGRRGASVINQGKITVHDGGLAAFVSPWVQNTGVIQADLGKVQLASADTFTVDMYGDGLIKLAIDDETASSMAATYGVENKGKIQANGGSVYMTTAAAKGLVDTLVNMDGVISATSVGMKDGKVVLFAEGGTTKASGTIDVSGKNAGEKGGTVNIFGKNVKLSKATIDATGDVGGGKVLVGGDYQGAGYAADTTTVDADSIIDVSALSAGNAGKAIIWSDDATQYAGLVNAKGGAISGDGGFVEVSGRDGLLFTGMVNTSAANGKTGELFVDPLNLSISTGFPTFTNFNRDILQVLLAFTDVTLATIIPGPQAGNITVADSVTWSSANTLRLQATNNLTINAAINGGGLFDANAGRDININAAVQAAALNFDAGRDFNSTSATVTSTGSTTINAIRDVNVGNLTVGDDLIINAGDDFRNTGIVNVADKGEITAADDLTIDAGMNGKHLKLKSKDLVVNGPMTTSSLIEFHSETFDINNTIAASGSNASLWFRSTGADGMNVGDGVTGVSHIDESELAMLQDGFTGLLFGTDNFQQTRVSNATFKDTAYFPGHPSKPTEVSGYVKTLTHGAGLAFLGGPIHLDNATITTQDGGVGFFGSSKVQITGNNSIDTIGLGDIVFENTIEGTTAEGDNLAFGNIHNLTLKGNVGNTTALGDLTIQNANNVTSDKHVVVKSFTQNAGTGTTSFTGTTLVTSGDATINNTNIVGNYDIGGNFTANASNDITFGDVTAHNDLTATAGDDFENTGTVTIANKGKITAADDVTINGALSGKNLDIKSRDLIVNKTINVTEALKFQSRTFDINDVISGSGASLMFRSLGADGMNVGDGVSGESHIDESELALLQDGFAGLSFGTDNFQITRVSNATFKDTVSFPGHPVLQTEVSGYVKALGAGTGINFITGPVHLTNATITTQGGSVGFYAPNAPVQLTGTNSFDTAGLGDVLFQDKIEGTTVEGDDLNFGNIRNLTFGGNVGNTTALGDVTIQSANNVTSDKHVVVKSFTQNAGTGTTSFTGTTLVTSGDANITTTNIVGNYDIGNDFTANASNDISVGNVTVGHNMTATAGDDFENTGTMNIANDGKITAADDVTINGAVNSKNLNVKSNDLVVNDVMTNTGLLQFHSKTFDINNTIAPSGSGASLWFRSTGFDGMNVGDGVTGESHIDESELAFLQQGFNGILFGTDNFQQTKISNATFKDTVYFPGHPVLPTQVSGYVNNIGAGKGINFLTAPVRLNNASFTTNNGSVSFLGPNTPVQLTGSNSFETGTGNVLFEGTVNGTTSGDDDLTFNGRNLTFKQAVGQIVRVGDITIVNANDVTAEDAVSANSLTQQNGQGTTNFKGPGIDVTQDVNVLTHFIRGTYVGDNGNLHANNGDIIAGVDLNTLTVEALGVTLTGTMQGSLVAQDGADIIQVQNPVLVGDANTYTFNGFCIPSGGFCPGTPSGPGGPPASLNNLDNIVNANALLRARRSGLESESLNPAEAAFLSTPELTVPILDVYGDPFSIGLFIPGSGFIAVAAGGNGSGDTQTADTQQDGITTGSFMQDFWGFYYPSVYGEQAANNEDDESNEDEAAQTSQENSSDQG